MSAGDAGSTRLKVQARQVTLLVKKVIAKSGTSGIRESRPGPESRPSGHKLRKQDGSGSQPRRPGARAAAPGRIRGDNVTGAFHLNFPLVQTKPGSEWALP